MTLRSHHKKHVDIQTAWQLILQSFQEGNEKVLAMSQQAYTLYFNMTGGLPIHMTTDQTLCPALLTAINRPIATQNVFLQDGDLSLIFHMRQLHDGTSWSLECSQHHTTLLSAHDTMRFYGLIPPLT